MRNIFFWGLAAIVANMCIRVNAQNILGLSNLGEPSAYSMEVASDSWLAIPFGAGDLPGSGRFWQINSVQLLMSEPSGLPEGFSVAIYNFGRTAGPNELVGSLSGPDPMLSGVFRYKASSLVVPDHGTLWIVLTSETSIFEGSFSVNTASSNNYESSVGWSMGGNWVSSDGLNWEVGVIGDRLQFAIYATPVPKLSITAAGDQIELRWEGFEGVTYQLQTRASLTNSEWADLGGPLTGDGSEITVPVAATSGESQSFYRVAVLPAAPASE